jgi:hypothetical protein
MEPVVFRGRQDRFIIGNVSARNDGLIPSFLAIASHFAMEGVYV